MRIGGLAQKGYCSSLKRWFYGVREHLIYTPQGRIAHIQQIPGNRHDVQGLYSLFETSFQGHLVGDSAYWPKKTKRTELADVGITITAATHSNWKIQLSSQEKELLKNRFHIERWISLFNRQFNASRTLCRSLKHYEARRWAKALTHNTSRHINDINNLPFESVAHYRLIA